MQFVPSSYSVFHEALVFDTQWNSKYWDMTNQGFIQVLSPTFSPNSNPRNPISVQHNPPKQRYIVPRVRNATIEPICVYGKIRYSTDLKQANQHTKRYTAKGLHCCKQIGPTKDTPRPSGLLDITTRRMILIPAIF